MIGRLLVLKIIPLLSSQFAPGQSVTFSYTETTLTVPVVSDNSHV